MSENTTEELAEDSDSEDSDSDSENQDSTARILVHVFLLGVFAVVAAAFSNMSSSPGSMLPLDGLVGKVLWLSFAVYALISSLGIICWSSWRALVGVHVAAGVLAIPAGSILLVLLAG